MKTLAFFTNFFKIIKKKTNCKQLLRLKKINSYLSIFFIQLEYFCMKKIIYLFLINYIKGRTQYQSFQSVIK